MERHMHNAWSNPDAVSEADAERMAAFIEARGNMPDQRRLYDQLVSAFEPQLGQRLLDQGCATGVVTRRLAAAVGLSGVTVGVDISAVMVCAARRLCAHPSARFETGDATRLRFDDASFDGAIAARLLLHVADPELVLAELRRVTRAGGRLGLMDWDWGTLAVDHSQRALTRRILDWRCDNHGGQNWMGRRLVRMCLGAGWQVQRVEALVSVAREADTALVASLRRAAEQACEAGVIGEGQRRAWLAEVDTRLAEGLFFATINDYVVIATAPK
jgi:ubiquinone/menaquinone biosynthesis C-methylase UbiE